MFTFPDLWFWGYLAVGVVLSASLSVFLARDRSQKTGKAWNPGRAFMIIFGLWLAGSLGAGQLNHLGDFSETPSVRARWVGARRVKSGIFNAWTFRVTPLQGADKFQPEWTVLFGLGELETLPADTVVRMRQNAGLFGQPWIAELSRSQE
jgi:hypothetical protein